jgi:hypothetical protein
MYVCMYICMYVHMYVCRYVCISCMRVCRTGSAKAYKWTQAIKIEGVIIDVCMCVVWV